MSDFHMDSDEMSALKGRLGAGADAYAGLVLPDDVGVATWGFPVTQSAYGSFRSDAGERVRALGRWCSRVADAVGDTSNQTQAMEEELQVLFAWDENAYQ